MDMPSETIRELDHRHADGIDVSLLWDPNSDTVSIEVRDERRGESMRFEIDPAEAHAAFQHPYAYAGAGSVPELVRN